MKTNKNDRFKNYRMRNLDHLEVAQIRERKNRQQNREIELQLHGIRTLMNHNGFL